MTIDEDTALTGNGTLEDGGTLMGGALYRQTLLVAEAAVLEADGIGDDDAVTEVNAIDVITVIDTQRQAQLCAGRTRQCCHGTHAILLAVEFDGCQAIVYHLCGVIYLCTREIQCGC